MRYSLLTHPLAPEADFLAASAPVDLPFNPVCFDVIGPVWSLFPVGFYGACEYGTPSKSICQV